MGNFRKIYLLLWKNFTLHRRHKLRLFVETVLPLFLFIILMILRKQGHRYNMPSCHFDQKAMPSTGFWPFFQNMICTFNNTCHPKERDQLLFESAQTSLHFVNNILSDIENISTNHITESKLKNFEVMFADLEAFSKLLRKLTDPYSKVQGMINVSVIFDNVNEVTNSIENLNISLPSDSLQTLLLSSIKLSGIQGLFDLQRLSIYAHLCHRDGISNLIYIEHRFRWRKLKMDVCSLSTAEHSSLIVELLKQVNWKSFYKQFSNVTIVNVGQSPPKIENIQEFFETVNIIIKELSDISSLSHFRDKVHSLKETNNSTEIVTFVTQMFQSFFCGRNTSVIFDPNNQGVEKKFEELKEEMKRSTMGHKNGTKKYFYDHTTNSKCNILFEFLETNENSFVMWQMFKPFIRGKILYSPVNNASKKIIAKLNETFYELEKVQKFLKHIADSLSPMAALESEDDSFISVLQAVENFISHINLYLESDDTYFGYSRQDLFDMFISPKLEAFVEFLISSSEIVENVKDYIECIDINRFQGFSTEREMKEKAYDLMKERKFFAGIVFTNLIDDDEELPKYIKYKIRMDSRNVESSKRLFDFFPKPGPRRKPTVELKYLTFGFAYLQEQIDHAIIKLLSAENSQIPGIFLQQFPYPCYILDQFLFLISLNYSFFMTVAWSYSCSMIVKGIVLEKQKKLKEILKILGVQNGVFWLTGFIEAVLIMIVSCILLTCIFVYGGILERSDPVIIFLYLIGYCVSTVSISFLMSTWFCNPNIASVAAGSFYFLLYLPSSFLNKRYEEMSNWNRFFSSLLPSSAFGLGAIYLTSLEEIGEGANFSNFSTSSWLEDRFSLAHCIGMMFLDSIIFMILALYIEAVFPGQYGIPRPWYYFVTKSYWCESKAEKQEEIDKNAFSSMKSTDDFEEEPTDLPLGVSIQNVSKRYRKHDKLALDNLSLNFYENQITSFLGENGAGKTTTISILTGLYPPTSGTAYVNGFSITENMDGVRRSMGVCPQYNVLFDGLTVSEHLWFYGCLKGASNEDVKNESEQLIVDLGLETKRNELACNLSGGMQRKLSIGIAFTAGSKTVILDEPTAGVDPYARRSIWELLLKYKNGRTIILTTHHMDEADLLGDRIAVIANGKLSCCGSSLFLKSRYGRGYYLTMVKTEENLGEYGDSETEEGMELIKKENTEDASIRMEWFVKNYISDCQLIENIGMDMTFLIKKSSQEDGSLQKLLENLEKHQKYLPISSYGISDSSFQEVFLRINDSAKEKLKYNVNANKDSLPSNKIHGFINFLLLLFQCFGYRKKPSTEVESRLSAPPSPSKQLSGRNLYWQQFYALIIRRMHHTKRNYKGLFCEIALPAFFVSLSMVLSEFTAGYSEEPPIELHPWHFKMNYVFFESKNWSSPSSRTYIESLLSKPGLGNRCVRGNPVEGFECSTVSNINYKALESNYNINYNINDCSCSSGSMKCPRQYEKPESLPSVKISTTDVIFNVTGINISDWLLKTTKSFYKRRFGGFSFGVQNPVSLVFEDVLVNISHRLLSPLSKKYNIFHLNNFTFNLKQKIRSLQPLNNIKVWFNNRAWISSPTFLNLANNIILRSNLRSNQDPDNYGISVTNHPMHYAEDQIDEIVQDFGDLGFLYSICIIFALSFVPASFIIFLIEEKSLGSKHLQYVSGLKPWVYYLSSFVWDIMRALIIVCLCILIFLLFNEQAFVSPNHFPGFSVLLITFCFSCIPLMYLASFLFNSAGSAFITLSSVNLFIGVLTTISIYILRMLENEFLDEIAMILEKVFLIFPHFVLGNGLMNLYYKHLYTIAFAEYGIDASKNPFSLDFLGINVIILCLQSILFLFIVLIIEYVLIRAKSYSITSPKDFCHDSLNNCDNDVKLEMKKARYANPTDYSLLIRDLFKIYHPGTQPAVNKLCLAVEPGQCFGLLGINGSGKTSTFNMLTGKISISSGDAFIGGISIKSNMEQALKILGFCPQFDALDNWLTAREHLEFYARISGIPEKHIKNTAFWGIKKLGLSRYANVTAGTYSGGNKRKLSTAIALIGNPAVIFLDEPTTGMDPHSRRFLWNCITDAVKEGHCVVLTSHSMEECEALCSRLAIMVSGQFKCIGSIQHLKNKYGAGYTLTLKAFNNEEEVANAMEETFGNRANLREHHLNQLLYQMHASLKLSFIFGQLEQFRTISLIETYSVSQTTLEQVFINFAKDPDDASISKPITIQSSSVTKESSPELDLKINNGKAVYEMDRETVV